MPDVSAHKSVNAYLGSSRLENPVAFLQNIANRYEGQNILVIAHGEVRLYLYVEGVDAMQSIICRTFTVSDKNSICRQ